MHSSCPKQYVMPAIAANSIQCIFDLCRNETQCFRVKSYNAHYRPMNIHGSNVNPGEIFDILIVRSKKHDDLRYTI